MQSSDPSRKWTVLFFSQTVIPSLRYFITCTVSKTKRTASVIINIIILPAQPRHNTAVWPWQCHENLLGTRSIYLRRGVCGVTYDTYESCVILPGLSVMKIFTPSVSKICINSTPNCPRQPSTEHGYKMLAARGIDPHEPLQMRGLMRIYVLQLDHAHFGGTYEYDTNVSAWKRWHGI